MCGSIPQQKLKTFYKTPALPLLDTQNINKTIPVGKVDYSKGVIIIYNPNSGKKVNSRNVIA